jgi:hypothetical protein
MGFIVKLAERDLPSWCTSQEFSSSSLGHALFPLRVIPAYRSPYSGARVAQTSGPSERSGGTLAGTQ